MTQPAPPVHHLQQHQPPQLAPNAAGTQPQQNTKRTSPTPSPRVGGQQQPRKSNQTNHHHHNKKHNNKNKGHNTNNNNEEGNTDSNNQQPTGRRSPNPVLLPPDERVIVSLKLGEDMQLEEENVKQIIPNPDNLKRAVHHSGTWYLYFDSVVAATTTYEHFDHVKKNTDDSTKGLLQSLQVKQLLGKQVNSKVQGELTVQAAPPADTYGIWNRKGVTNPGTFQPNRGKEQPQKEGNDGTPTSGGNTETQQQQQTEVTSDIKMAAPGKYKKAQVAAGLMAVIRTKGAEGPGFAAGRGAPLEPPFSFKPYYPPPQPTVLPPPAPVTVNSIHSHGNPILATTFHSHHHSQILPTTGYGLSSPIAGMGRGAGSGSIPHSSGLAPHSQATASVAAALGVSVGGLTGFSI